MKMFQMCLTAEHEMSNSNGQWDIKSPHYTVIRWKLDQGWVPNCLWCHKSCPWARLLQSNSRWAQKKRIFSAMTVRKASWCRSLHIHHSAQWSSNIQLTKEDWEGLKQLKGYYFFTSILLALMNNLTINARYFIWSSFTFTKIALHSCPVSLLVY